MWDLIVSVPDHCLSFYFTARDVGMVVVDVALAIATKDMVIKQGVIPADIMK